MDITEYRKLLKKAHLCRECRKQDAFTLAGHTLCAECRARNTELRAKKRKNNPQHEREIAKKRYYERKAKGLCPNCGKRKAEEGKSWCRVCVAKANKKRALEAYAKMCEAEHKGLCCKCKKKPRLKEKKLCKDCYDKVVKNARKATEVSKIKRESERVWRGIHSAAYC
jgi:hypothetical protein